MRPIVFLSPECERHFRPAPEYVVGQDSQIILDKNFFNGISDLLPNMHSKIILNKNFSNGISNLLPNMPQIWRIVTSCHPLCAPLSHPAD